MKPVHWMVDGGARCGAFVGWQDGVEVTHAFDPNQLKVTCGQCCAYLVSETMGDELNKCLTK